MGRWLAGSGPTHSQENVICRVLRDDLLALPRRIPNDQSRYLRLRRHASHSVDLHAIAWHEAMLEFGHDVSFERVRS